MPWLQLLEEKDSVETGVLFSFFFQLESVQRIFFFLHFIWCTTVVCVYKSYKKYSES